MVYYCLNCDDEGGGRLKIINVILYCSRKRWNDV